MTTFSISIRMVASAVSDFVGRPFARTQFGVTPNRPLQLCPVCSLSVKLKEKKIKESEHWRPTRRCQGPQPFIV